MQLFSFKFHPKILLIKKNFLTIVKKIYTDITTVVYKNQKLTHWSIHLGQTNIHFVVQFIMKTQTQFLRINTLICI
jgi:hypothetical protein